MLINTISAIGTIDEKDKILLALIYLSVDERPLLFGSLTNVNAWAFVGEDLVVFILGFDAVSVQ